ncbi:MAG: filamentous hemagglutinin N-terminal domain-containing protein, partial [Symploca sp. SIO3C6]|nr:filamentous hemagglutinin N-terminal domain-containing protein [Symploca sp. SIO3C6]
MTHNRQSNIGRKSCLVLAAFSLSGAMAIAPALAQTITPDGSTGTTVAPDGNRIDINGGQLSGDGANLFHSFSEFGIDSGQIANFLSSPELQNILSRVTGGNLSVINGLLQVTGGNPNLFLLNPAGIVFGPNAQLNLPASFTATTATGIGFDGNWFNAFGANDYATLVGSPNTFAFNTSEPGAIINSGQLSVNSGQNLSLLGGTVVSNGQLEASEGQITVASVEGNKLVRLSQEGLLLNLEIEPTTSQNTSVPNPLTLPELLTGGNAEHASSLQVNANGEVVITGSGVTVENGDVVANRVDSETALLSAANDLTLIESQLTTTRDLQLLAQDKVFVRDSVANPFVAQAGDSLYIQGNNGIDILALNHPQTAFQSGGELSLVSDGNISGDAHFASGGNFSILNLSGEPGNFFSLFDPIISVDGDVTFGPYTGVALKVEATGSITGGNITITGPDEAASIPATDPHFNELTTSPSLILQAGKTTLDNAPNLVNGFTPSGGPSLPASINVGSINTSSTIADINAGSVILGAPGNIAIGPIDANGFGDDQNITDGGQIFIDAGGNITVNNIGGVAIQSRGRNGGDITITAGGSMNLVDVFSVGNAGMGGNVTINAGGNISSDGIATRGNQGTGNIIITSGGSLDTSGNGDNGGIASCTNDTGFCVSGSGDITITAESLVLGGPTNNPNNPIDTGTLKGRNIILNSDSIQLTTAGPITSTGSTTINGNLTTQGQDLTINAQDDIQVSSIDAAGGNIAIETEGLFRATDTIDGTDNSISTNGVGSITITHGGGNEDPEEATPFTVGPNYNEENGTVGAIATGTTVIDEGVFFDEVQEGNIGLITQGNAPLQPPVNPPVEPPAETPGNETPVVENPGNETPVVENPGNETPVVENPGNETPVVENPGNETPVVENPGNETPVV